MQGNLNAFGLIIVPLLTAIILWRFGNLKPKRIIFSLIAGLFTAVVMVILFSYKCGDGNNPVYQMYIPALCLTLVIMFVNGKKVLWLSSLMLFLTGYILCWHFHFLIFTAGIYTGEQYLLGCSQSSINSKQIAIKQWHTPLTGLYKITK